MLRLLRSVLSRAPRTAAGPKTTGPRPRPTLEALEAREVPTVSSIAYNFNGTAIKPDSTVWFSSVAKVSGVGTTPATISVTHQSISFVANGAKTTVDLPDSHLTLTAGATTASAEFDASANAWNISTPSSVSGNVLLGGGAYHAVFGIPGGVKNVTWTADFSTDTAGLKFNWQWAGAVYTRFNTDLSQVGVKAVDSSSLSQYKNSHHAGTPENYTSFVVGGGSGGGGSNFTGSYSSTKSVVPEVIDSNPPPPPPPPPSSDTASLSGHVYFDADFDGSRDVGEGGLSNWTIILTGTDSLGHDVRLTAKTDPSGLYTFSGLQAGTYQVSVVSDPSWMYTGSTVGKVGDSTDGVVMADGSIGSIILRAADSGMDYDFGEVMFA